MEHQIKIRNERKSDYETVEKITREAFYNPAETMETIPAEMMIIILEKIIPEIPPAVAQAAVEAAPEHHPAKMQA